MRVFNSLHCSGPPLKRWLQQWLTLFEFETPALGDGFQLTVTCLVLLAGIHLVKKMAVLQTGTN